MLTSADVTNVDLPQFNFDAFAFQGPSGHTVARYAQSPYGAPAPDFIDWEGQSYLYGMGTGVGVLGGMTPLKWAALAAIGFFFLLPRGRQRNPRGRKRRCPKGCMCKRCRRRSRR